MLFRVPGGHKARMALWRGPRAQIMMVSRICSFESCARLNETPAQFQLRVRKVEACMNSHNFASKSSGRGLAGLAKDLKMRCMEVLDRKGERIPH